MTINVRKKLAATAWKRKTISGELTQMAAAAEGFSYGTQQERHQEMPMRLLNPSGWDSTDPQSMSRRNTSSWLYGGGITATMTKMATARAYTMYERLGHLMGGIRSDLTRPITNYSGAWRSSGRTRS